METIESIPSFILDATEIVESVFQFRSKKVFLFLKSQQSLELLLPDLLFLQSSEISFSILQQVDEDASLKSYKAYNLESSSFFLGSYDEKTYQACRQSFLEGSKNLYHLFYLRIPKAGMTEQEMLRYVFSLGQDLKPWKMIFFFNSFFDGAGHKISHQKTQELNPALNAEPGKDKKLKKTCRPADATQELLLKSLEQLAPSLTTDVVSLDFKVGALFYELFTLAGSGTLFSATYSAKVRSASLKDLAAIIKLINAPMAENRLTKIDWFTLQANLANGFVYAIDHSIVGFAMLNVYENLGELAKFATFPRYQGRGIAKELAFALIQKAKDLNLEGVFALSIDPKMGEFFQTIGFIEQPREKLPLSWQKSYDFSRPSKAYLLSFGKNQ